MRVLVIEDEALIAFDICDLLVRLGHEHIDVQTIAAATAVIRDAEVDLIISDLALHDGQRTEAFLKGVRAAQSGLPIIIITGLSECRLALDARTVLLQKPFQPAELVAAITRLTK